MGKLKFSTIAVPPGTIFKEPKIMLATWFGAGLIRPAPGTMGTFAALPFGYLIMVLWGQNGLAIAAVILLAVGTAAADYYCKKSGIKDDQSVVVDEAVGMWIAALPAGTHIALWLLAALLFRFFDIWKPWPASLFNNRSRDGLDVMMDDVVAGIYALLGVSIFALYGYP
jgi:phosphatidylglycerophosphatase A